MKAEITAEIALEDAENWIFFSAFSAWIPSNFLFRWQDYVLTSPREEILQGWTG
jgi:hypothetical protein